MRPEPAGRAGSGPAPEAVGPDPRVGPTVPLLELPAEWRLSMKKEHNVANHSRDFSDIKRTCNRSLQKMYSAWQAEVTTLRAVERCSLQMAQSNLMAANTVHVVEKHARDKLKEEHEALKTKLQQATSAEEEHVRKVAYLNRTRQVEIEETESKHEAALAEKDKRHQAEISDLKKEHQAKVMEAASKLTKDLQKELEDLRAERVRRATKHKAKLEQAKKEYWEFREKVSKAVVTWNKRTKALQRKLHKTQLQRDLFKACVLQTF